MLTATTEPRVNCCKEFDRDVVTWSEPEYDWSRKAWCIRTPTWYGESDYHPIRHCPWCGAKLPQDDGAGA